MIQIPQYTQAGDLEKEKMREKKKTELICILHKHLMGKKEERGRVKNGMQIVRE